MRDERERQDGRDTVGMLNVELSRLVGRYWECSIVGMSKTGESSRFSELRTPAFSLRIAPAARLSN